MFFRISNEQDAVYQAGISIPYSEEYKIQKPSTETLEMITNRTNGKLLTEPSEVFREMELSSSEKQSIQHFLLLVAIILFFIDITIRRFGFNLLFAPFKRSRKKLEPVNSTTTTNVGKLVREKKKR